jgi:hypothetical protein
LLCFLEKKATVSSSFYRYKKLNDTMFIFPIDSCTISMALITIAAAGDKASFLCKFYGMLASVSFGIIS